MRVLLILLILLVLLCCFMLCCVMWAVHHYMWDSVVLLAVMLSYVMLCYAMQTIQLGIPTWAVMFTVLQNTEKSPGLASVKMGSAVRLPCSCEVRSELFLHRKCCHLPSVRACGAQRLVRVRAGLCTLTPSAQKRQHIDTTGSVVESVYLVFR